MSNKVKVILFRHGKTNGNLLKQYIGKTDENLCEIGINEIMNIIDTEKLINKFQNMDMIFSSPYKRCIETLNLICKNQNFTIIDNLKESDFGEFEQKNYEQLKNNEKYITWLDSGGKIVLFGGENTIDFKQRCIAGFLECINLATSNGSKKIIIFCHGGVIMSILEYFSKVENSFYNWQVNNANGFDFDYDLESQTALNISKLF